MKPIPEDRRAQAVALYRNIHNYDEVERRTGVSAHSVRRFVKLDDARRKTAAGVSKTPPLPQPVPRTTDSSSPPKRPSARPPGTGPATRIDDTTAKPPPSSAPRQNDELDYEDELDYYEDASAFYEDASDYYEEGLAEDELQELLASSPPIRPVPAAPIYTEPVVLVPQPAPMPTRENVWLAGEVMRILREGRRATSPLRIALYGDPSYSAGRVVDAVSVRAALLVLGEICDASNETLYSLARTDSAGARQRVISALRQLDLERTALARHATILEDLVNEVCRPGRSAWLTSTIQPQSAACKDVIELALETASVWIRRNPASHR